ncbi:MAG: sulfur carrier protein ThiS [bacterium]|nr:sulfur carrier protein ThiS [bacterium]
MSPFCKNRHKQPAPQRNKAPAELIHGGRLSIKPSIPTPELVAVGDLKQPQMMNITFNGEPREVADSASIADLLSETNAESKRVAVEVNFELIPRELHATHQLQPDDRVEVVTLAGGG